MKAPSPLAATTRCGLRTHASAAQIRPVTSVATTRMNEKSKTKEHPCERGAVFRNCFGYSTLCVTLCAQPSSLLLADLQHREEGFLRNLDGPELLHALLAFLLLLEQLALAGDVAAVALGQHVLADRLDRFAGDDPAADRRLDRDLEHL